jgi:hypothetical protein
MTTSANYRPGVDAGWRVLFAFQRPWPRATQAGCSLRWRRSIDVLPGMPRETIRLFGLALTTLCALVQARGQGTMTVTFERMPSGTQALSSLYVESGMNFWNPYSTNNLVLNGGGIASTPENGTGYLQVPGGATLGFSFFTLPLHTFFGLVSLDAAEIATNLPGPATLQVVGYGGMGLVVTNNITTDGINDGTGPLQDFQTFYFGPQFANVYRIDIFGGDFSMDNVVVSGVPEPSTGMLILLGTACAFGRAWVRSRRL